MAVYGEGVETMEEVVVGLARAGKIKLATAESCTGGLVASRITDVAGASEIFVGGWVTYSNESKARELGVKRESSGELNKYGTTMSLMLLPHWTNGCIGSMEGLNFEAAGTTPYHFITSAAMSKQSSNPVRELRYDDNNAGLGVRYLQELGVRYFMAFTQEAIDQANLQAALVEVARSGPWVIYQVSNSELVVPLAVQPVIANSNVGDAKERWLEIGTSWFQHPEDWAAVPAADGPDSWQHVDVEVDLTRREGEPGASSRRVDIVLPTQDITVVVSEPVQVTNIVLEDSAISFSVDKIGQPILVRMSYFPNWKVSGAKGPYRIAPNMMVVVPTQKDIRLHYGFTKIDSFAYLLTALGIAIAILRWRRRSDLRMSEALIN